MDLLTSLVDQTKGLPLHGMGIFALIGLYTIQRTRHISGRIVFLGCSKLEDNLDVDVLVVGGGPAGSTAAYFAAKSGLRVAVFDKKHFPRNKPCGDAWCAPALKILEEMGVLPKMEKDRIVHPVKRGGLISPFGYKCINTDGDAYGSVTGCKTYAIKREIADEYLVRAAGSQGAILYEGHEVISAVFTQTSLDGTGFWTVRSRDSSNNNTEYDFTTRLLFICDGSTSYLAQKLGLLAQNSQAEAVSSTAYLQNHQWKEADGVMIFSRSVLPGYSALFRHYNGDLYLGTYILPGGRATARSIAPFETEASERHPYIRDALGDHLVVAKKRTVAPIRIGAQVKSFGQQVLLIGDAAGHVDPLTGEGIHTAMIAGKIAGLVAAELHQQRNFSLSACQVYSNRVFDAFGYEFLYSSIAARVVYYCPIAIDAVTVVGQRRGQAFLDFFGEVMTGVKPKSAFLQPDLLIDIVVELVRQIILQYVLKKEPLVPQDIGAKAM